MEEGTDVNNSPEMSKQTGTSQERASSEYRAENSQNIRPSFREIKGAGQSYTLRDASNTPGGNWDVSLDAEDDLGNDTLLDWANLQWKPHFSSFLKGNKNWVAYKEALLLQLRCIGYKPRMQLTPLDEVKLAALIQRTSTPEATSLVAGMTKGTDMMTLYESTFRQVGELQQESLYQELTSLRYKGGCPVRYVTSFKTAVREYRSVGGEMALSEVRIVFKQSVKEKAGRWHSTVSAISRFQNWDLEHLYQDFTSHFYNKIGAEERETHDSKQKHNTKGSINNNQQDKINIRARDNSKGEESRKNIKCFKCKKIGHYANKCPNKSNNENRKPNREKGSKYLDPPAAMSNEYCSIPEEELSGSGYTAQADPQTYQEMVEFYEKEMAIRKGRRQMTELPELKEDRPKSPASMATIGVTQQIMKIGDSADTKNRWLFDTGADIDATNQKRNFRPGTIVDLGPKQFPIRTGNGIVYAECVGEVWLTLKGKGHEKSVIRIKYTLYLKDLPVNIISGERFYKSGGYLEKNRLIDPEGNIISYIDTLRRGFFLWIYNQPEPLKSTTPKKTIHYNSHTNKNSCNPSMDDQPENLKVFKETYMACSVKGVFKMSDELMRQLILWHRRLCHPSAARMRWTISNTVGINMTPKDVENLPCEACDMGKSIKHMTVDRRTRLKNVGEGWHCDVGSLNPESMEGYRYFCLTTEDVSRYRIFRALKQKSEASAELKSILSRVNTDLRQKHNSRVRQVVIDGGRDWGLNSFQEFAEGLEIEVIISAPNNQYQNGVSERGIRFIQDAARCCSIQMKVPSIFWNHMLEMACYTLNRTSQSPVRDHKTPHEVYWSVMDDTKMTANVGHLWIPGTLCITHVDTTNRIAGEKLEANGTKSVFLGYKGTKNKLVWLLDGGRFLVSPHVTAYESVGPELGWAADPREIVRSLPQHVRDRLRKRKTNYARNNDFNRDESPSPHPLLPRGRGRPKRKIQRPYADQEILTLEASTIVDDDLAEVLCEEDRKGLHDAITGRIFSHNKDLPTENHKIDAFTKVRKAVDQQIYNASSDGEELFRLALSNQEIQRYLIAVSADEPSFREAIDGPEKTDWVKAMFAEIESCLSRSTFKFVPRSSANNRGRLVTSKWVMKKKYNSDMELEKFKARIVARGFMQTLGVDYNETSSTTARSASWRILMALAALNGWYILQADFISAYLAGELKETIFMEQFPYLKEYFEAHPQEARKLNYAKDYVIELRKPLYGLKQSGACWQEKIREIMKKKNYFPLISDNAIYQNKQAKIIVASYIDDFLLLGQNRKELECLVKDLNSEVALNDLGDASWFLGVRIQRSSPTGNVKLDQNQYIEKSLQELKIKDKTVKHLVR